MQRYLPIAVGVLVIVGFTIVQARMTDRLAGSNVTTQQRAELLKNIPMNVGDWQGTDKPIDEAVRKMAGAEGAVSRQYRNVRTNDVVDLWLIVGHGRAVSAHTPDVCYPSSGFSSRVPENSLYPMEMEDGTVIPFLTNTFIREDVSGRSLIRVFWNWYNTERDDNKVVWEAPTNARWHFGNTRALYKMYFTAPMRDQMETSEQSPALEFANVFIPVANQALSKVYQGGASAADGAPAAAPAADAPKIESPATDAEAKPAATPAAEKESAASSESEQPAAEAPPAEEAAGK